MLKIVFLHVYLIDNLHKVDNTKLYYLGLLLFIYHLMLNPKQQSVQMSIIEL